jgi:RNA polymerase sigma factor (sigma-70 family)
MTSPSHKPQRVFPTTHVSVVEAAGGPDPEARRRALESLVAVYWRPAYLHLRLKWNLSREEAEDLTQEFFARAMERGFFEKYQPERARFRTFLRGCLDHLIANTRRDERRLKRGGGATHIPLDFAGAEEDLALAGGRGSDDLEGLFHREWVRSLFTLAVEALRAECLEPGDAVRFQVFSRCDLDPVDGQPRPSYRELAAEFGVPVTQVTNHLAWARREFRRVVLERLRELSGSEAEFRAEARELFGMDPP